MKAFSEKYGTMYGKAVICPTRDREPLLSFDDFPAEHRDRLRTSHPIGSMVATVRTRGALSQRTAKLMAFPRLRTASNTWRQLNGTNQLPRLTEGVAVTDGVAKPDPEQSHAACSVDVTRIKA